jgi:hypothetical protein
MARVFAFALGATGALGALLASTSRVSGQSDKDPLQAQHERIEAEKRAIRERADADRRRHQADLDQARAEKDRQALTGKGKDYRAAAAAEKAAADELAKIEERVTRELSEATAVQTGTVILAQKRNEAEAERAKAERAKVEADAKSADARARGEYLKPALQAGLMIGLGVVGAALGRKLGKGALDQAKATLSAVRQLGKDAATINKSSGVIANTPAGETMRGIVKEAKALGGKDLAFAGLGATPRAGNVVQGVVAAEGAVNTALGLGVDRVFGFDLLTDENRSRLLAVGAGSLGLAGGMKLGLAATKAQVPRPSSRALASIRAGEARLSREIAGRSGAELTAKAARRAAVAQASAVTAQGRVAGRQGLAALGDVRMQGRVGVASARAAGQVASARAQAATAGIAKATAGRIPRAPRALPPPSQQPMPMVTPRAAAPAAQAAARSSYVNSRGQTVYGTPAQIARWNAQKKG